MSSPVTPNQVALTVPTATSSICGNFRSFFFQFPLLISQFLTWLLDTNGNISNAAIQQIVQPGDLIFSASSAGSSAYRLLCDGSAQIRANYPQLFLAIGTIYGAGDGSTTFNLPDYRCKFPVGAGQGAGTASALNYTIGQAGGEALHQLTVSEMAPHSHTYTNPSLGITATGQANTVGGTIMGDNNVQGGGGTDPACGDPSTGNPPIKAAAHNNIPPFCACYIFIKT